MSNEERSLKCEHLAFRFERAADLDETRAATFRGRAAQKSREVEEHPEAPELRALEVELMGVATYWDERAAWSREIAKRFSRMAESHRAIASPGLLREKGQAQ
ncbi:hypothetical protein P12x_005092 [Tundrisphaera lichenicola]|uniref:hypothetical protein n=1 Tax=Tundrisphaera lichenicola TaxID=2029860 RepID=UPI003EBD64D7